MFNSIRVFFQHASRGNATSIKTHLVLHQDATTKTSVTFDTNYSNF